MRITKCDICKKTIKDNSKSVYIGIGSILRNIAEICENCGKPIIKILEDNKFTPLNNFKFL